MRTSALLQMLEEEAARWRHVEMDNGEVALRKVTKAVKEAIDSGYLGDLYRTDYQVTGHGAFPIDMLRYTVSWPTGESDAQAIEDSIEKADATDPFTITLSKYHRDPKPTLAEDRWLSKFRWKVLRIVDTVAL